MSAFGKRGGIAGARPSFGVARPMKGGGSAVQPSSPLEGGDQFPPIDELTPPADAPTPESGNSAMGAMDRLTARQNASGDAASSKTEGFEEIGRASCRERV